MWYNTTNNGKGSDLMSKKNNKAPAKTAPANDKPAAKKPDTKSA
jgi:hypothetical protein